MSEILENANLQEEPSSVGNKTAVVAIIGRPSVGKSTFLNTASGEKISIVSPVPQTTRNAVKGIINTNLGQLVFIDTPGYHNSEKKFNLKLRSLTKEQLDSCDAILYLIDATRTPGEEEELTSELLQPYADKVVVGINKIDLPSADVDRVKAEIEEILGIDTSMAIPVSAKTGIGIEDVLEAIVDFVPPPVDTTEKPLRALVFDSAYDPYLGTLCFFKIMDGKMKVAVMEGIGKIGFVERDIPTPAADEVLVKLEENGGEEE